MPFDKLGYKVPTKKPVPLAPSPGGTETKTPRQMIYKVPGVSDLPSGAPTGQNDGSIQPEPLDTEKTEQDIEMPVAMPSPGTLHPEPSDLQFKVDDQDVAGMLPGGMVEAGATQPYHPDINTGDPNTLGFVDPQEDDPAVKYDDAAEHGAEGLPEDHRPPEEDEESGGDGSGNGEDGADGNLGYEGNRDAVLDKYLDEFADGSGRDWDAEKNLIEEQRDADLSRLAEMMASRGLANSGAHSSAASDIYRQAAMDTAAAWNEFQQIEHNQMLQLGESILGDSWKELDYDKQLQLAKDMSQLNREEQEALLEITLDAERRRKYGDSYNSEVGDYEMEVIANLLANPDIDLDPNTIAMLNEYLRDLGYDVQDKGGDDGNNGGGGDDGLPDGFSKDYPPDWDEETAKERRFINKDDIDWFTEEHGGAEGMEEWFKKEDGSLDYSKVMFHSGMVRGGRSQTNVYGPQDGSVVWIDGNAYEWSDELNGWQYVFRKE